MTAIELHGAKAQTFAEENLQKVRVDVHKWETHYVDPRTGEKWVMDHPQGHLQGGGPPRLRRVD